MINENENWIIQGKIRRELSLPVFDITSSLLLLEEIRAKKLFGIEFSNATNKLWKELQERIAR